MAPTTILDQVTTTTPAGKVSGQAGYPVRMCEVLAVLDGILPGTVAVHKTRCYHGYKKSSTRAFRHQLNKTGFSMSRRFSPAPRTGRWIPSGHADGLKVMSKQFPIQVIKEVKY